MARPHNLRKSAAVVPTESALVIQKADELMTRQPIPQPKPWSDDVERAAIWHCLHAAPPNFAMAAAGVNPSQASHWLSEDAPEGYKGACAALSSRLKEAEQACAAGLFANIHKAAQDPRYWTAAAWTLERKHGFIAQNQALSGPATVVNIGQVIIQAKPEASTPNRAPIIDTTVVPASIPSENP